MPKTTETITETVVPEVQAPLEALRAEVLASGPTPATITSAPEPATVALELPDGSAFHVPTLNKLANDANSVVARIPLLPGEETSKITARGFSVRRLDAYDWDRLQAEAGDAAVKRGKLAVKRMLAIASFSRAFAS